MVTVRLMKRLGADLACFISLVDSIEGQSLQHAQELVVLVLLESSGDELQRSLHAHKTPAFQDNREVNSLFELLISTDVFTPWRFASPGPHRWGEAFSLKHPYHEPEPLDDAQGLEG